MTHKITVVRHYGNNPSAPWVIDVTKDTTATGYVQPDGTSGKVYEYASEEEALVAEALYLAKNVAGDLGVETSAGKSTCGVCEIFRNTSACHNHCIDPRKFSTGAGDFVGGCELFKPKTSAGEIRQFDTGATRDTATGKLSYPRILSPIALRRYVEYMNFHAKQSDGTMREPDNWKTGFPEEVYLDSLGRHFVAAWLLHQGFTESDNHGSVTLENALCGIIFNAFGWLHEEMKKKLKENNHLAG